MYAVLCGCSRCSLCLLEATFSLSPILGQIHCLTLQHVEEGLGGLQDLHVRGLAPRYHFLLAECQARPCEG